MSTRYRDANGILGRHNGQITQFLLAAFPEAAALQTFVRTKLGHGIEHSVSWTKGLTYVCSDMIRSCQSRGSVGQLLEALEQIQPQNEKLGEFINELVEAGYLTDGQKPQRTVTATKIDWIRECRFDRYKLDERNRALLIAQIAACFPSRAKFERFLLDNFPTNFGRQVAHQMGEGGSVERAVSTVVGEFANVGWLTAFVAAVQSAHADNLVIDAVLTWLMREPAKPAPQPAAAPAAPAAKPNQVLVHAVARKLPGAEKEKLVKLLVGAFDRGDLERLCSYRLDERMDSIVGNGSLLKQADGLVQWCVDQGKVADLLNGMLEERRSRTDIREFVQRLHEEGYLSLAG